MCVLVWSFAYCVVLQATAVAATEVAATAAAVMVAVRLYVRVSRAQVSTVLPPPARVLRHAERAAALCASSAHALLAGSHALARARSVALYLSISLSLHYSCARCSLSHTRLSLSFMSPRLNAHRRLRRWRRWPWWRYVWACVSARVASCVWQVASSHACRGGKASVSGKGRDGCCCSRGCVV